MAKVTTEQFIENARKVHGDKYDYSKVIYEHSKKDVIIICPIHGEFSMRPNNHLNGQGCPNCGGTKKLTKEAFIEKSKLVHGNKYDYSKVTYENNKKQVIIICPKHGEFKISPNHHMRGVGCKKCHFEKLSNLYTMQQKEFVERANKIHNNKYTYGEYKGYDKIMEIFCPTHGKFLQTPHGHLSGLGCRKCSNERMHKERTKGFEKFVEEANAVHMGKYTYLEPYINKDTPINIICPIHGKFQQPPKRHLKGCGCPKCNASHLEREMMKLLKREHIEYIHACGKNDLLWLGRQHLDFYLPKRNIAIECQGGQHYFPSNFGGKDKDPNECFKKIQERDKRKRKLCEEHNVKLLYFSDKQYEENVIIDENKLLEEINKL